MTTTTVPTSAVTTATVDVATMVTNLVNADKANPQQLITNQTNNDQASISAYGTLTSDLNNLSTQLATLQSGAALQSRTATSSVPTSLSATVGNGAAVATHSVVVQQLAQNNTIASAAYATTSSEVGSGQMTISVGSNSFSVNVSSAGTPPGDTLQSICDAINNASGNSSVNASIVQATDGAHLVLQSQQSGAAGEIKVAVTTGSSDTGNLGKLAFDSTAASNPMTEKVAGQDALLTVDGFQLSSASNTVTSAISGVTMNLSAANAGQTISLQIGNDSSMASSAINAFVSSYNQLMTDLGTATAYNATTKTAGQLQGDSTTAGLISRIRSVLNTSATGKGVNPTYSTLASLGITSNSDGTLSVNSTTLNNLLASNSSDVANLFGASGGFATNMSKAVKDYTSPLTGLLVTATTSLQSQLTSLGTAQTQLNTRMAAETSRYTAQFTAMNALVASLNNTSSYLAQQLANLPG